MFVVVVTRIPRQSLYGGCTRPNSARFEADSPRAGDDYRGACPGRAFSFCRLGGPSIAVISNAEKEGIASIGRQKLGGTSKRLVGTHCSTEYRHGAPWKRTKKRYPILGLPSRVEVVSRSFRGTGFSQFSLRERRSVSDV